MENKFEFGREGEEIEFKESLGELDSGIKSLTAMLNKSGRGQVVFGLDDKGNPVFKNIMGQDTLSDIAKRIGELCKPSFYHHEKIIPIDDEGHVLVIVEAEGEDRPYSHKGVIYVRNGDRDEQADGVLVRKLVLSGRGDILANMESDLQELTFDYFKNKMVARNVHFMEGDSFFISHSMMKRNRKFNFNGFLLSDQNTFPLKVVTISGLKKGDISSIKVFQEGSLFQSMDKILAYIETANERKVDLSHGARQETDLFSYECFREAISNAVVHNAWNQLIPPSVYIYDDRIEIESYGDLPFDLSLENFFEGRSQPVNPTLFQLFVLGGYCEQSGRGIPFIVEHYGREAFFFTENMVKVTIPFNFTPDAVVGRKTRARELERLSPNEKRLYDYLSENPTANLKEAAEHIGISETSAKTIAKKLQDKSLLERVGSKKIGRWMTLA